LTTEAFRDFADMLHATVKWRKNGIGFLFAKQAHQGQLLQQEHTLHCLLFVQVA